MTEINGNPQIKMHIQYQQSKDSPLIDLGEIDLGEAVEQITEHEV